MPPSRRNFSPSPTVKIPRPRKLAHSLYDNLSGVNRLPLNDFNQDSVEWVISQDTNGYRRFGARKCGGGPVYELREVQQERYLHLILQR
jgi:hypothetical protein